MDFTLIEFNWICCFFARYFRSMWDALLKSVRCEIISFKRNDEIDAYVLRWVVNAQNSLGDKKVCVIERRVLLDSLISLLTGFCWYERWDEREKKTQWVDFFNCSTFGRLYSLSLFHGLSDRSKWSNQINKYCLDSWNSQQKRIQTQCDEKLQDYRNTADFEK